ncbi:GPR84 [Bugula neritina]|uniref:GPR84 n=1 Tax=Bugula neritina TaxID=10212 RepID=A0A7J7JKZ1_BUGNE|nr:GPR84 [Bugula neritina]
MNQTDFHFQPRDYEEAEEAVNTTIPTIAMALYCIISVIGVIGNSLTIISILINKKLKSIPNVYIGNLAAADFVVCAVIAPFSAYLLTIDHTTIPSQVCTFIGALNIGLLGKTMFGLAAIAVNRYILLVRGSELYTRLYSRKNVALSVVVLWTMPVMLVLPALLGFGQFGYNSLMGTCIFISHDSLTYIYVQTMLHGVCVGPCTVITLFCYISIIIHFRRTQNRLKMSARKCSAGNNYSKSSSTGVDYVTQDSSKVEDYELSSSGPSNNNSSSTVHIHTAKRNRASRRIVTNLCTVFVVFLCCWLPIVTIFTIDYHSKLPASVYHIFFAVAVTNSCLNVFIYAGMNRAFRRTYCRLLTCRHNKVNSAF